MSDPTFNLAIANAPGAHANPSALVASLRNARILVVDNDPAVAQVIARLLEREGAQCIVGHSGAEALALLEPSIDLLVTDASMPEMTGFELVRRIRAQSVSPELPVLMVSALDAPDDRIRGIEVGVDAHLAKPFDPRELVLRCSRLIAQRDAREDLRRSWQRLAHAVDAHSRALDEAAELVTAARAQVHQAQMETLERLAISAEYRDTETYAHIQRVGEMSGLLARRLGLDEHTASQIQVATRLHDIGKIGIPDAILLKPGRLTSSERRIMQEHTRIGADILGGSSIPAVQLAEQIALTHHEWWDGSGYPAGLRGEEIPLAGRICAVVDVFDALTSARPYKKALSNEEALLLIRQGRGTQFEPRLVDLLLANRDEVEAIQKRIRDDGVPHLQRMTPPPMPSV